MDLHDGRPGLVEELGAAPVDGQAGFLGFPDLIAQLAIEDALSPFSVHFAETPLTPERIVAELRAVGAYESLSTA